MEDETVSVRCENEGDLQHLGVTESLLHAIADCMPVVLGLYDGNRDVWLQVEHVVGALLLATRNQLAADGDTSVCQRLLFSYLGLEVPACALKRWRDELTADISFREKALVH